ncbi:hypothetical protein [Actinomadura algeriensis]|uniref:Lipoprotein n=1 Tax=Actinomadura algeriensis TaxID=1679523 RepID=A0ABR9JP03_9ACTN|nr:hypothetical protein [Actinomadura algeriensis]MBE1532277.1 hypothetical protein [Actinomadura algeriensis]
MSRRVALTMTVVVAAFGLTACGGEDRWCEHDATDKRVGDSHCEKNEPGYEWESDGGKTKTKTKKKSRH